MNDLDETVYLEINRQKKPKNQINLGSIDPVLYLFKVSGNTENTGYATLPPYWVYQDHTFGVIWILFDKRKSDIVVEIPQLQWCLKFLTDLKNSKGEYTKDVGICIDKVQDLLIQRYALLEINHFQPLIASTPKNDNQNITSLTYNSMASKDLGVPSNKNTDFLDSLDTSRQQYIKKIGKEMQHLHV